VDDQGRAIAVWNPLAGGVGGRVLQANRYTPNEGWLEPVDVEDVKSDDTTTADGFRLDVGPNGDAFVIWEQSSETEPRDDIWTARFAGGVWEAPERIDDYDADEKSSPDIALDGTGNGYAVWSQTDEDLSQNDGDIQNIWVAEFTPGARWDNPILIEPKNENPDDDGDATTPRIDVNRDGNVFVVWGQVWDQWPSIWSNRRDPDTSWNADNAERIEDFPSAANQPIVAVDEARHAHSLWRHSEGNTRSTRTNRFE
jgi:hypothetical protein